MRGEDPPVPGLRYPPTPSPPHARGRPLRAGRRAGFRGITPACAGKTPTAKIGRPRTPDHPRMRGEDATIGSSAFDSLGSPPHARGRRVLGAWPCQPPGITPACAGKTQAPQRGAGPNAGSPPHARGRLPTREGENMTDLDHPRMRGEDPTNCANLLRGAGSPPHARGRPADTRWHRGGRRITPACAGKTIFRKLSNFLDEDHPRMRGEDVYGKCLRIFPLGSPPHARGRRS